MVLPTDPLAVAPPWIDFEAGPWPVAHDEAFDFQAARPGYGFLDDLAQAACNVLGARRPPTAVCHADWECQNVRFSEGKVVAVYDMDSLLAHEEAVLVGLAAGIHTAGSVASGDAPSPTESRAFVVDYETARGARLDSEGRSRARAATMWVVAYNARCDVESERIGYPAAPGSFLHSAHRYRLAYLEAGGEQ